MAKKRLTTVKEVLTRVRNTILTDDFQEYICNVICNLKHSGEITSELHDETMEYLMSQRPSETLLLDFFKSPYMIGESAWWHWVSSESEDKKLKRIKRKYLKKIIANI